MDKRSRARIVKIIADIPDLKYVSAIAETPQQALNEVILAKTAWLEAAKAENKNIPKPRYRPVIYQIVA